MHASALLMILQILAALPANQACATGATPTPPDAHALRARPHTVIRAIKFGRR
jgi:hypothetical protein